MPHNALRPLAVQPRPTTIGGVLVRLHAIEAALPEQHGISCFNRLYRWTTEHVSKALRERRFEEPHTIAALDVAFANLYFDAVDAWAEGRDIPGAWAPLFEHAHDTDISPLRFALAGMNAHINRDLAVALVRAQDTAPVDDTPRFRDYMRINQVLDETSDDVRDRVLPPALDRLDARLGELDDRAIIGLITAARRLAWEEGQRLWVVREGGLLWDVAVGALDLAAGGIARGILMEGNG